MLWKKQASEEVSKPNNASTSTPPPTQPNKRPWTNISVALTVVLSVTASWTALRFYKRFLRRIPNISHLHPDALRTRSLYGYVTRVGDGDNFRFFHTPLGIFAGWGWLPSRRIQDFGKKELQDQTLHVRIAGVDAPECAHFGRPAQPYSAEALEWLKGAVEGRYVRVYPLRKDQYERVVGKVVSRWVRKDLGMAMIKTGCATVYEAKFGSEFAGLEEVYRKEEEKARAGGKGMWKAPGLVGRILGGKGEVRESPREYKNRMKAEDTAK